MSQRETTVKVIDEIIRFMAFSGVVAAGLALPNVLIAFNKPLGTLLGKLDERDRERELRRVISNMKSQGYLVDGSYEHGLQLTDKARTRLQKVLFNELTVVATEQWDHFWRIILYDIPESKKYARNALNSHLRAIGCFQLQRSVWITPFPCRDVVVAITANYDVDTYVTYFEAKNLDNERTMISYFKKKYPATHF